VGVEVVGVDAQAGAECGFGVGGFSRLLECGSEVVVGIGIFGVDLDGHAVSRHGFEGPAGPAQGVAQVLAPPLLPRT